MTKLKFICQAAGIMLFCAVIPAGAQDPLVGGGDEAPPQFSADALDQLLRPIALYPDPLLAEIFAAATMPAQIVLADRYLNDGGDPTLVAEQPWDPSVQALAHYPTVLKWLDDNLPWTTEVGQAFLYQQPDVMASIQHLRYLAQEEGNLHSTPQENIVNDDGVVEIEPVNPEIIYVPVYPWDSIYYNPGVYCSFGVGFPIGIWLRHDWDWHNHHLIVWGPGHQRPANWWSQPPRNRVTPRGVAIWHGPSHSAAGVGRNADRGWAAQALRPARVTSPSVPAPVTANRAATPPREGRPGTVPGFSGDASRPGTVPGFSGGFRGGTAPLTGERPGLGAGVPPSVSRPAPEIRVPAGGRSVVGGGAFGGSESSSEARQSSMRGVESRGAVSAPARSAPSAPPAAAPSAPARPSAPPAAQSSQPSQSSGSRRGR